MCLAIPGEIVTIDEERALPYAQVSFGGLLREVCLAYVPHASVGDFVIVHVGFALSIIDEQEAMRTLRYLEEIDALEEEL